MASPQANRYSSTKHQASGGGREKEEDDLASP